MARTLFKHNPAFLSDEELEEQFVIRKRELSLILEIIQGNTSDANQHLLMVGPRGMGKSMLMRRVALTLRTDPDLSVQWLPVVLPEENYTVATEGELWLRALSYAPSDGDGKGRNLIVEDLRAERDEARLRSRALARLKEISESSGKRLVVMVENLNTLIEDQSHPNTGWNLRKTLLNEPAIMLLGTATARFDEIENAGKSMFELFREIKLAPLPTEECIALWRAVTGEALSALKIRPLEILTGGNPRLLTILASFAGGASFQELMKDLIVLIDDHTTYFKANVESLPPLERRIYATLAEIWSPAGAREVAEQARLDVGKTSAQLNRLVSRGAVVEVDRKGRKNFYQVAERLYNIYHLMRQSSTAADRAKAVVDFMVRFYDIDRVGESIAKEACTIQGEDRKVYIGAYRHLLCNYAVSRSDKEKLLSVTPEALLELDEIKQTLAEEQKSVMKIAPVRSKATREFGGEKTGAVQEINALFQEAIQIGEQDPLSEIAIYDQIIARFGNDVELSVSEQVARALFNKGATLGAMDRSADEIAVYDEMVRRFEDRQEAAIAEQVARALVNKGYRLGAMDRSADEIAVYDEMVRRFENRPEASIAKQVAGALFNKGVTLGAMDRSEDAIAVYDEAVRRFENRPEASIAERVAGALVNKGYRLRAMDRSEDAIAVYDEVVRRFENRPEASIAEQVARALVGKGIALRDMEHLEEAEVVFDDLLRKVINREEESLNRCYIDGVIEKTLLLLRMKRSREAASLFADVLGRNDFPDELQTRIMVRLMDFAAEGFNEETLRLLTLTPAETKFEPLVVALKMMQGEEINAPQEVVAVAKDVMDHIKKRRIE